jgi:phosphopantothenoylcysteine synthetase/decarboxylase
MNILVTAGNTLIPIDKVRMITNIFTGRTGTQIALHGHARGHQVTLLTSHPELVEQLPPKERPSTLRWSALPYKYFSDLRNLMQGALQSGRFDALIHTAAVSDYEVAGVYGPSPDTFFSVTESYWGSNSAEPATLVDRAAGKISSAAPELWLRLVRTPKLIDLVRSEWKFPGIVVKFKLEVGATKIALLNVAEHSRRQSGADLMVANTLEEASFCAYLGPLDSRYEKVSRSDLPQQLLDAIEALAKERKRG